MLNEEVFEMNVPNMKTKEEALSYLADKLISKGIVKESYKQAIIDREHVFPTGLQFEAYGIAIPHTDVEHVNKEQIALMTLKDAVSFYQMGTNDVEVPVRVIFMLALKEAHSQLTMLQQLMEVLQDKDIMERILSMDENTPNSEIKEVLALKNIK